MRLLLSVSAKAALKITPFLKLCTVTDKRATFPPGYVCSVLSAGHPAASSQVCFSISVFFFNLQFRTLTCVRWSSRLPDAPLQHREDKNTAKQKAFHFFSPRKLLKAVGTLIRTYSDRWDSKDVDLASHRSQTVLYLIIMQLCHLTFFYSFFASQTL